MTVMMIPLALGPWEIVGIVAVALLLFGGKKIPELMRGLGQGVRSFRKGMNDIEKEITAEEEKPGKKNLNDAKEAEARKEE